MLKDTPIPESGAENEGICATLLAMERTKFPSVREDPIPPVEVILADDYERMCIAIKKQVTDYVRHLEAASAKKERLHKFRFSVLRILKVYYAGLDNKMREWEFLDERMETYRAKVLQEGSRDLQAIVCDITDILLKDLISVMGEQQLTSFLNENIFSAKDRRPAPQPSFAGGNTQVGC